MSVSPSRVLVTGANGFIGAWTLSRLRELGIAAVAVDLQQPGPLVQRLLGADLAAVRWHTGDVTDTDFVVDAARGCDGIAHLAGVLTPFCAAQPVRGAQINLIGVLNAFEAARVHGLRQLVFTSSAGVYGPTHADFPEPTTHYGAFKLAAEGSARAYWQDHSIASVALRPFVVYGPGRDVGASAGVSLACEAAMARRPYTLPFTGAAGMVHVDDVVDAIVAALSHPLTGAHAFNLLGEVRSTQAVIDEIRRQAPWAELTAEGAPLLISADLPADGLHSVLPGLTTTALPDGIARTMAGYARLAAAGASHGA